jgi:cytochrome c
MNKHIILLIPALALSLVCSLAFAMQHTPEERGKTLFNDPKFADGQKACSQCHPDGKGLQMAGDKKQFKIMGDKQMSLEEAVNVCIVNANKGKAIDTGSEQMKDIVAYIKSFIPKKTEKETGGYK